MIFLIQIWNVYLLCSFECIIGVHDGMDQVIHSNKPPGSGSVFRIWIPTIQQYCNMVIPKKKEKISLTYILKEYLFGFGILIQDAKS